jgi:hypothetical protein
MGNRVDPCAHMLRLRNYRTDFDEILYWRPRRESLEDMCYVGMSLL